MVRNICRRCLQKWCEQTTKHFQAAASPDSLIDLRSIPQAHSAQKHFANVANS